MSFEVAYAYSSAAACATTSSAVKAAANQSTNHIAAVNAARYANPINMQHVDTSLANITGGVSSGVAGQGQHHCHAGSRHKDREAARASVPSGSGGRRAHGNATQVINRSHASSTFKPPPTCATASSADKAAANQSTSHIATENARKCMNPIRVQQVDTTLASITGGVSCGIPGQGQHLHHTGSRRMNRVAARTSGLLLGKGLPPRMSTQLYASVGPYRA
jgi:hypothetical protein